MTAHDTRGAVATEPPVSAKRRLIGLDGARGLSCLGVAIMHISAHYSPDTASTYKTNLFGMGLIFFYVLSGFLLFLPYVRSLVADRAAATLPSTKNFTIHRVARIMPGYLAIFLLVNYVFSVAYLENAAMQPPRSDAGTGTITDPWQLIANLTLVHSYLPQYFQTGLNPSWSLTLEFAFYASLPLLGMLLFAVRKRTSMQPYRIALVAPLLLIAIGFSGKLAVPLLMARFDVTDPLLVDWGSNWVAVFLRSFVASADNFAFGMLAAVVVVAIERGALRESWSRRVRAASWTAIVPACVVCAGLLGAGGVFALFGVSAVAVLAALAILVIVAPLMRGEKSAIATLLETLPFRFVGKVSLSAYLWHFPVMLLFGRWGLMGSDSLGGMLYNVAIGLCVTLLVSTVTYYAVEQPIVNWARRYRYGMG
ncbi:acyltransferase [Mycolicibacterium arabiense]|uniref:Acyltransferase n=1 Tax=Mycolicibacterium arabiense TaxID=1286181 RepID=A0A7I7RYG2_9MYCO|nr:acyltransferase [Mycolicibacterium arabiense]MCV7373734.1 acyltransferase [Mycolicibacterium arabiense]BBY48979.1 acyltransferase [Mycolicibacterium arabiense]